MKRNTRHKIKREMPETSSAYNKLAEEHDLAYYIHDRVELMHQVFSVLKHKDLRAMAPDCVRRLSIDDMQELCTEELLGISSKRLLAILDGAEPPSDTESSSQSSDHLEAISLESISSDEEILSQENKKKHKHKRRNSKAKKHRHKKSASPEQSQQQNKASRAGLTVLELLELQARARAIRAQLQQEQAKRSEPAGPTTVESSHNSQSSDSEVEIKEEPAEIVVLSSSEDEKPNVGELDKAAASSNSRDQVNNNKEATSGSKDTNSDVVASANKTVTSNTEDKHKELSKSKKKKEKSKKKDKKKKKVSESSNDSDKNKSSSKEPTGNQAENKTSSDAIVEVENIDNNSSVGESNKVTKRVNNLVITVPQQSSRKIKLNRSKMTVSVSNVPQVNEPVNEHVRPSSVVTVPEKPITKKIGSVVTRKNDNVSENVNEKPDDKDGKKLNSKPKSREKGKKKTKKKEKRDSVEEDHDEITLQLSDSEKMDLLQDFDRKNYDKLSSSSSDSESSSETSDGTSHDTDDNSKVKDGTTKSDTISEQESNSKSACENKEIDSEIIRDTENVIKEVVQTENVSKEVFSTPDIQTENIEKAKDGTNVSEKNIDDCSVTNVDNSEEMKVSDTNLKLGYVSVSTDQDKLINVEDIPIQTDDENNLNNSDSDKNITLVALSTESDKNVEEECEADLRSKHVDKDTNSTSNKDLSDGELSSNESSEVEAFDVNPEVVYISDEEVQKKKKKKDKKSKKDKKKMRELEQTSDLPKKVTESLTEVLETPKTIDLDDDELYEILELSDDSSCYEVEGITLSKEPTDEEIAALSAKIDEIEEKETFVVKEIENIDKGSEDQCCLEETTDNEQISNISWKDRYLESKKVKKVLTTSNIFNALRKKNKDLKKKMEDSKKRERAAEIERQKEIQKQQEKAIENSTLEEGSIDQYNTLQGSTKYVDPVPDPIELARQKEEELKAQELKETEALKEKEKIVEKVIGEQVTGEMKKDAKQLLKIYKKLLKYNDITKVSNKDPNKKKNKKKKKKSKDSGTNMLTE